MAQLICVHSFRGGTGKSNLSANLAGQLARRGARVAVIDTDVQSPGVHVLFGVTEDDPGLTLNDFLWGRCTLPEAARDVTDRLGPVAPGSRLFLIPSSMKSADISRVLREGYDVSRLDDGFAALIEELRLDHLIVDTHPGLNEETLLTITIADAVVLLLRPDNQDFQGTAVTVEVARKLEVPRLLLVLNKVPAALDRDALVERVSRAYRSPVAGVLRLSEDVAGNASGGLFSLTSPDHAWSREVEGIAAALAD